MRIKVLFFAQLREAFGTGERTLEAVEGTTVAEIIHLFLKDSGSDPLMRLGELPLLYAVNEELVAKDKRLRDQDTVAILPPVAGGK